MRKENTFLASFTQCFQATRTNVQSPAFAINVQRLLVHIWAKFSLRSILCVTDVVTGFRSLSTHFTFSHLPYPFLQSLMRWQ